MLACFSGCAKQAVLKEEITPTATAAPKVSAPAVKAPEKSVSPDKETVKKRAEQEQAAKEEARKQADKLKATAKEAAAVSTKGTYEMVDIHFAFDKFNLMDEARGTLSKHAEWLNKNKAVKIVVEGHCDERGTAEYNLALGERRANAVVKFLLDLGIDSQRIKAISYGAELPLDHGHNEEAWAKNRRVHFIVHWK